MPTETKVSSVNGGMDVAQLQAELAAERAKRVAAEEALASNSKTGGVRIKPKSGLSKKTDKAFSGFTITIIGGAKSRNGEDAFPLYVDEYAFGLLCKSIQSGDFIKQAVAAVKRAAA